MKRILLFVAMVLTVLTLASSCKSKQAVASGLPAWLQEKVTTLNERYSEITRYEMDGATYYAVFVKGPEKSFDMNRTTIYDANGEVYLLLGGLRKKSDKENQFFRNAINKGVVWQSDAVKEKNRTLEVDMQMTTPDSHK